MYCAVNVNVGRGVHLHDDQTLKECKIPTESQLVLLDNKASFRPSAASHSSTPSTPTMLFNSMKRASLNETMTRETMGVREQMKA